MLVEMDGFETNLGVIVVAATNRALSGPLPNTAVEAVVDLASPEYHRLAKRAKDVAAGAVLIAGVLSVFVGATVWWRALMG